MRSLEPYLEWQSTSQATVDLRIVLGFQAEQVAEHLEKAVGQPLQLIYNPDWESGMSSSIRIGLQAVSERSYAKKQAVRGGAVPTENADYLRDIPRGRRYDGVLIGLADMPWISPTVFESLAEQLTPGSIVCPVFDGKRGHPILLGSDFFGEMQEIRGDVGARSLLKKYPERIQLVDVQEPGILEDIDQLSDCPLPLPRVLIRGANEFAAAVACCLKQNGFEVAVLVPTMPQLDGLTARLFPQLPRYWGGAIPVVVDREGLSPEEKDQFEVVVDARMLHSAERSTPDKIVIGLGPGFKVGLNADVVVEVPGHHDLDESTLKQSVQSQQLQGLPQQESVAYLEPRFQEGHFSEGTRAVAERVLQVALQA